MAYFEVFLTTINDGCLVNLGGILSQVIVSKFSDLKWEGLVDILDYNSTTHRSDSKYQDHEGPRTPHGFHQQRTLRSSVHSIYIQDKPFYYTHAQIMLL